jgi:hypothetical protein
VLLTDDRKATIILARPDVVVSTTTTVSMPREWKQHNPIEADAVRTAVKRISVLARFTPRRNTPDWQCGHAYLPVIEIIEALLA